MTREQFIDTYKSIEEQMRSLDKNEDMFKVISNNVEFFQFLANAVMTRVDAGNFNMYYQPHILDEKCIGAEALFRIKIADVNINPAIVFATARYFEFEEELTIRSLEAVAKDVNLLKTVNDGFITSFNINPKLFNRHFCNEILGVLYQYNVAPKHLGIELLECSSCENLNVEDMNYLKSKGVKFALDDFGSGYSNMETLKAYPFDIVKFDGTLIHEIDNDPIKQRILSKVVDYCYKNDLVSIAEKVETYEECRMVKTIGVDIVQGYYYSKPITAEDLVNKYGKIECVLER